MDFMDAVKTCLRKYFTFRGRAQRSEYWWFYLFTIIVGVFAQIIDGAMMGWANSDQGPVGAITTLAFFIPSLSAGWRRLHDTGRSGWWIGGGILGFIAFGIILVVLGAASANGGLDTVITGIFGILFLIGLIVWGISILVFLCQDSYSGDNVYGRSTKYDTGSSVFD
jgi:uncharacterized membrane protein YhaH (DUF805 family)